MQKIISVYAGSEPAERLKRAFDLLVVRSNEPGPHWIVEAESGLSHVVRAARGTLTSLRASVPEDRTIGTDCVAAWRAGAKLIRQSLGFGGAADHVPAPGTSDIRGGKMLRALMMSEADAFVFLGPYPGMGAPLTSALHLEPRRPVLVLLDDPHEGWSIQISALLEYAACDERVLRGATDLAVDTHVPSWMQHLGLAGQD